MKSVVLASIICALLAASASAYLAPLELHAPSAVATPVSKATDSSGAPAKAGGLMHQIQFSPRFTILAYAATFVFTACCIVVLYWSRGFAVIAQITIYLVALSTMKLSVKWIYVDFGFNYPKFVTMCHFASGALVAFVVLLFRSSSQTRSIKQLLWHVPVPTFHEFACMVVPIALSFAISVGANNMALLFSSAAFTEIVAAASPVASILIIVFSGLDFNPALLLPTLLVVGGCALSTSGEVNFSALGMTFCLISVIARSVKTVLQGHLMTGPSKEKFDPVCLLAWMCLPSFLVMGVWSLSIEGTAPFKHIWNTPHRTSLGAALLISCVNACMLNLSNLICTKDLGAVGVQLVAQMKSVLTVMGAVAFFRETLTVLEIMGFGGVLLGVYLHSKIDKASSAKKGEAALLVPALSQDSARKAERAV